MRSYAVFFVVCVAVVASIVPPQQLRADRRQPNAQNKIRFLCRPCTMLLTEVQRALPTLDGVAVEELDKVVKVGSL